jgi:hypothetical protein
MNTLSNVYLTRHLQTGPKAHLSERLLMAQVSAHRELKQLGLRRYITTDP